MRQFLTLSAVYLPCAFILCGPSAFPPVLVAAAIIVLACSLGLWWLAHTVPQPRPVEAILDTDGRYWVSQPLPAVTEPTPAPTPEPAEAPAAPTPDFAPLTVPQLRAVLKSRGVKVRSKAKRAELLALLAPPVPCAAAQSS